MPRHLMWRSVLLLPVPLAWRCEKAVDALGEQVGEAETHGLRRHQLYHVIDTER